MCLLLKESIRIRGLGLLQNESIILGSLRRYGSTRLCVSVDFPAEKKGHKTKHRGSSFIISISISERYLRSYSRQVILKKLYGPKFLFQLLERQDMTNKNQHHTCHQRMFSKPRTFNVFDSVNPCPIAVNLLKTKL